MSNIPQSVRENVAARLHSVAEMYELADRSLARLLEEPTARKVILGLSTTAWMEPDQSIKWKRIALEIMALSDV